MPKEKETLRFNIFEQQDEEILNSIIAQEKREELERFEQFLKENRLITLNYRCCKDETHQLEYILLIEGNSIQKIGQYPSYADIDFPQVEIYRKELGREYYKEFKRAIGLYSSNVGIGAYVYLRRIIEKMILDGLDAAKLAGKVTQEQFEIDENNRQRRVDDKIRLLADYLPKTLVENKTVYGIVSKGIHELTEEDCKKYFPVLEQLIKMCLGEIIAQKRKIRAEEELKKKINEISVELKEK